MPFHCDKFWWKDRELNVPQLNRTVALRHAYSVVVNCINLNRSRISTNMSRCSSTWLFTSAFVLLPWWFSLFFEGEVDFSFLSWCNGWSADERVGDKSPGGSRLTAQQSIILVSSIPPVLLPQWETFRCVRLLSCWANVRMNSSGHTLCSRIDWSWS